ncbi:MAG: 16S rRNA (guanine(527)-N(7))-methyltransferase RsmG [Ignavibacteria bacterium]|nr:16S rRNA (guanine(527)-N(7))-methyltransferase RsmG [Ignavibacteria bacterium]
MLLSEFWTILSANGIILDEQQLRSIERYEKELSYWNEKVNLISRKDSNNILENHILHSLTILKYVSLPHKARAIDVGTGGGLPGIPLKIARPDVFMTLIDSISKKIKITSFLAKHTGLRNIDAICMRAEDFAKDKNNYAKFDVVFARAVAKIGTVASWVKNLLKSEGKMVFLKGGDLTEEIRSANKLFKNLKFEEHLIDLVGYEKFKKDEKKIVVCYFQN